MAIIATLCVDDVTAQSHQFPVLPLQVQVHRRDLKSCSILESEGSPWSFALPRGELNVIPATASPATASVAPMNLRLSEDFIRTFLSASPRWTHTDLLGTRNDPETEGQLHVFFLLPPKVKSKLYRETPACGMSEPHSLLARCSHASDGFHILPQRFQGRATRLRRIGRTTLLLALPSRLRG